MTKTAIVTGAARGIGRAIALRLAQDGIQLVLNYLRDDTAMAETRARCARSGFEPLALRGDVGDPATAAALCDAALTRYGHVDVLVNNAGVVTEELLVTSGDDAIDRMIDTNVRGVIFMTRAVLPTMLKQRAGAIVNLSSVLATKPGRGVAVYAGTKGFVESFTRATAVEVARKGIRVNAVAPGIIETDMTAAVRAEALDEALARTATRRLGRPEEVAAAVAYLASDAASYVSGSVLHVDGAFVGGP